MELVKTIIIKLIFFLKIYDLFHFLARDQITILYLHGIQTDKPSTWQPLRAQTTVTELSNTLTSLSSQYTFISLNKAIQILKKEIPPIKNALVITLDDGYLNNITLGTPLFKKFTITPTIFIATEHTNQNKPFWFDRLDYALQQITQPLFTVELHSEPFTFNCQNRDSLKETYQKFRTKIKKEFTNDEVMRSYLDKLCHKIETTTGKKLTDLINHDENACIANWQQLKEAQQNNNFEIGSHTVNHARLALTPKEIIELELVKAKNIIEKKLNIPCLNFCYPDNSYNNECLEQVKKHYSTALTTDVGLNKIGNNLLTLKRFNIPTSHMPEKILFKISALRQFISQQR
jgi:peptidoglycan/xylan/chitin deacetylase (PgdA/CDA1 family)